MFCGNVAGPRKHHCHYLGKTCDTPLDVCVSSLRGGLLLCALPIFTDEEDPILKNKRHFPSLVDMACAKNAHTPKNAIMNIYIASIMF